MKILIGTNNKHKLEQFKRIFRSLDVDIQLFSLEESGITDDVVENGSNLLDNARKKAEYYGEKSGMPTLADDTGLFIDFLDGAPGIHAKRWHPGTDMDRCEKILEILKEVPKEKRTARYIGALVLYDPQEKNFWEYEGKDEGIISEGFKGDDPFGYNMIFRNNVFGKNYSELTHEEKDSISHRSLGARELIKYLKDLM